MLKHLRSSASLLAAAVVLAALGCLMLYGYLSGLEARVARDGRIITLPVARVPIAAGSIIREEMLQAVDFPDVYLLPTMLADPAEACGAVALTDIRPGDPLLAGSVSSGAQGGRASLMLEAGRRAYPLGVADNRVPLEELCAGDRVDLVFIPPEGRASVILHSVTVLCLPPGGSEQRQGWDASGALPSFESGSPGHVLLSLTPDEAETLAEAEERGRVLLAVCPAAR